MQVNDILHKASKSNYPTDSLKKSLGDGFKAMGDGKLSGKCLGKVLRMVDIWQDRRVFSLDTIASLKGRLKQASAAPTGHEALAVVRYFA